MHGVVLLLEYVRVIANVPKLLLDNKTNVQGLLSAMVVEDIENGFGVVRIIPSRELSLPVEIISIDPATVILEAKTEQIDPTVSQEPGVPSDIEQDNADGDNPTPVSN